jgi:hypothetical protein
MDVTDFARDLVNAGDVNSEALTCSQSLSGEL